MELSAAARRALPPPAATVRAVVVVPARDEELWIGRCLDALVGQVEVAPEDFEVVVVLDSCEDGTAAEVEAARREGGSVIHVVDGIRRIEEALAPGGTLLAVHWRHPDPRRELTGDDVHVILDEGTSLILEARPTEPDYLPDRCGRR